MFLIKLYLILQCNLKLKIMKAYYKNYLIEPCEGMAYIPNAPKLQIINTEDCDASIMTCNTLEEAKQLIDDEQDN